ncbi:MAG: glycosyltransferase [Candidatus Zixiibacteriota bacterium]
MTIDRLRVLVLADSRAFHTARYVAELRRQNCRVLLASLEDGQLLHHQLRPRGFIKSWRYALAATEVRTLIRRFQPHVVNPHYVSGYGFTAALAQARRFAPVLTHLWGSDVLIVPHKSIFHRRKTMFALHQSDFVTGDSEYIMQEAQKLAPLERVRMIPWGIEERHLQHHRTEYALQTPLRIIVPRNHEKVYNNEFIVRALAPLIVDGRVVVTFPAFGSMAGHFRLIAKSLVGNRLNYYERLSRAEFMRFMAQHDCYLSAAISDSSPVSLIEAKALGLIPIAADIPGVREWLEPESGYRYELYNGEQLLQIVTRLVETSDPHVKMRQRNLERVKREALFEQNVADMIGIMRTLVEERKQ